MWLSIFEADSIKPTDYVCRKRISNRVRKKGNVDTMLLFPVSYNGTREWWYSPMIAVNYELMNVRQPTKRRWKNWLFNTWGKVQRGTLEWALDVARRYGGCFGQPAASQGAKTMLASLLGGGISKLCVAIIATIVFAVDSSKARKRKQKQQKGWYENEFLIFLMMTTSA